LRIVIIGGGASGISLAVKAAWENPNAEIEIIDKNNRIGKKILATGNGKCNISNVNGEEIASVLQLFESIGLMIREEEEGRLYPYSEQASSVVEAFERETDKLGIKKRLNTEVEKIEKIDNGFKITIKNGEPILADRVALATGGKAAPQFGTTGDGFRFAKSFGHSVTKLAPSLMPIICEGDFEGIKGVRAKGIVTLQKNKNIIAIEKGEIQFIDHGLSGICIFNLSRMIKIEEGVNLETGFKGYSIMIDLVPEISMKQLEKYLLQRQKKMMDANESIIMQSILNRKLADYIYERAIGKKDRKAAEISAFEIERLCKSLKECAFTVIGGKGWKEAQCTRGGINLEEINTETMESKIVEGLFFGGEIIDYDGPCGGYNLQNAWLNGLKAGHNIVKETKNV
jgi:predicted Rossmann fold flavoprotein